MTLFSVVLAAKKNTGLVVFDDRKKMIRNNIHLNLTGLPILMEKAAFLSGALI